MSLQTGANTLSDTTKGSATPGQRGSSLLRAQRGCNQDAGANKGAGVLDLPGELASRGQSSKTTEGESTGCQSGTSGDSDIFDGQHKATGEVSMRDY